MKRVFGNALLCAAVLLALSVPALAGDEAPAWLQQAAAMPVAPYTKDAPAVVLLDESRVTVEADGRTTTVQRFAVRVLVREGRAAARMRVGYIPNTSKVREMKAWLVRDGGPTKAYGKDDFIDIASSADDVYNEARARVISAVDDADKGTVFGCEYVLEDRPLFNQDVWPFQGRLPVVASRLTLAMPAGWTADSVTFNHAKVEPSVAGSVYTWELRDLAGIPEEAEGPPVTNLAPRLAYTYFAPEGAKAGQSFANWTEVSRWATQLMGPQATPNDAISAKARELTASAKTEMDRIRAIGRHVQDVKYISIQTNLGRGGGLRPHAAVDVFAKSYGDCKDKANLMVTMLKTVGVTAYPVAIYSGDPTYVRREWATPTQFNHCIVAVKVTDAGDAASTIEHPTLGKLLIFDPTDTDTPVGDLPDHEQGSFALLIAGDDGALVTMPAMPPIANRIDRETEVTLAPDGSISGRISERSTGGEAVTERRAFTGLARTDYDKRITRWIASGINSARVTKIAPADDRSANRFALDVEFAADRYAQIMQGRLFVFKPALVSRLEWLALTEPSRTQPVVLDAEAFSETAHIKLPEGFEVDETPDPVKLQTPFGTYTAGYEVKDGTLVFTRAMVLERSTLPAADYAAVRAFFEKVRTADQAPVVLVRK